MGEGKKDQANLFMIIRRENERTIKVLDGHFFARNRQRTVVKYGETNNENSQKYFTSFGPFLAVPSGPIIPREP
jgi:hypothetical protein